MLDGADIGYCSNSRFHQRLRSIEDLVLAPPDSSLDIFFSVRGTYAGKGVPSVSGDRVDSEDSVVSEHMETVRNKLHPSIFKKGPVKLVQYEEAGET